jgi:hypothetical protein
MVIVPIVRASPTPEAERIERRDKAAFWLGMTLAVIVGLNAEYFGKPFGALDDYQTSCVGLVHQYWRRPSNTWP